MFYLLLLIFLLLILLSILIYFNGEIVKEKVKDTLFGFTPNGRVFSEQLGVFMMTRINWTIPTVVVLLILYMIFIGRFEVVGPMEIVVSVLVFILMVMVDLVVYSLNSWLFSDVLESMKYKITDKGVNNIMIRNVGVNKIKMKSPEFISFSGVSTDIKMHESSILARMWTNRDDQSITTWINNNLILSDNLLDVLENEFSKYLHILVATSTEMISPSVPFEITGQTIESVTTWLDINILQLIYKPMEINSQLHKLIINDVNRERWLTMIRDVKNKVKEQYKLGPQVLFIIIYQRLCMLEIIYRKTVSWRMSNINGVYSAKNDNMYVAAVMKYHYHENPENVPACRNSYPAHYSNWTLGCRSYMKIGNAVVPDGINGYTVRALNIQNSLDGEYYKYETKMIRERAFYNGLNQRIENRVYRCRDDRFTEWQQSNTHLIDMNIVHLDEAQRITGARRTGCLIKLTDMVLKVFDVTDDVRVGGRYRYINEDLGYRWLELFDDKKRLMMYAGDGDFKPGVRKIKKLKLTGGQQIQEMMKGKISNDIEVEWDEKEEHNDHTYAHNLSMVKRAEVINKLSGQDIILEVGSNLNSQIYTSGLILNLATITQSDVERHVNLIDNVKKLLNWEIVPGQKNNHYVCLNFQSLNEIDLSDIKVERVLMHNVIHNIKMEDTVKFFIDHQRINVIETSTYLPINVLNSKILCDEDSKMKWIYSARNPNQNGLFYESEGVISANMPGGDPIYIHDPAILHDYFRTTAIHIKNQVNDEIENCPMMVFTIKDVLNSYVRLRITKNFGTKGIEEAVLSTTDELPHQVIHVKRNLFSTSICVYPFDVSEMYKDSALLNMNNTQQREHMMKAVRSGKDEKRALARIRIVDAMKSQVPISVFDPVTSIKDRGKEHIFILSTFSQFKRTGKSVIYQNEIFTKYKEEDFKNNVKTGNFRTLEVLLSNQGFGEIDVDDHDLNVTLRSWLSKILLEYNLLIVNGGVKFYVDKGEKQVLKFEVSHGNIGLVKMKISDVYPEQCVFVKDVNDIMNILMFELMSHSETECVKNFLKNYNISRVTEKEFYTLGELNGIISNRITQVTMPEGMLEHELSTMYQRRSDSRQRYVRINTITRTDNRLVTNYQEHNLSNPQSRYILICGNVRLGNMILGNRLDLPQNMTDVPIQALIIKGHIYEVVAGSRFFLENHYVGELDHDISMIHVTGFDYSYEPMEFTDWLGFLHLMRNERKRERIEKIMIFEGKRNVETKVVSELIKEEDEVNDSKTLEDKQSSDIEKENGEKEKEKENIKIGDDNEKFLKVNFYIDRGNHGIKNFRKSLRRRSIGKRRQGNEKPINKRKR